MKHPCPFCGRRTTYKGRRACFKCMPRLLAGLRALSSIRIPRFSMADFRIRDESLNPESRYL